MKANKFLQSISGRYGFDTLYYHSDHVKETPDGLKAGVDLPWYWRLSRFTDNTANKLHWLRHTLSPKSGNNWDAVAVGHGVFENWYFWQYSDTSY
jgi:hypothetical protein